MVAPLDIYQCTTLHYTTLLCPQFTGNICHSLGNSSRQVIPTPLPELSSFVSEVKLKQFNEAWAYRSFIEWRHCQVNGRFTTCRLIRVWSESNERRQWIKDVKTTNLSGSCHLVSTAISPYFVELTIHLSIHFISHFTPEFRNSEMNTIESKMKSSVHGCRMVCLWNEMP